MVDDDIPKAWRRRQVLTALPAALAFGIYASNHAFAVPPPVDGILTQGFHSGHNGVDFAAPIGTHIYAVEEGEVIAASDDDPKGFGLYVSIRGARSGCVHTYGHVNAIYVEVGQWVAAGDHIADVGNRGSSTGPHLHWRVTTPSGDGMDPLQFELPPEPDLDDHPEPPVELPPTPGLPEDLGLRVFLLLQQAWQDWMRAMGLPTG